ncbi:M23 family metallopeptidase [Ancylobacter sp. A5.8]|uniref:M23 family metallopeptidase n=1 Tax=Ancylobacter gelatini TaxID=2919920 RepID=UPI001F4E651B|nr:M23 family metallopeptidase [Ancylobacter gelatini]MCJ8143168.1 M23 family metallopeptidase [Ancylobacter gelatini]
MRNFLSTSGSQSFLRLSIVALLGGSAAACSSDTARFSNPNASPFASQGAPAYTGSVASAPTGAVQRGPINGAPQQVASATPGPYGAAPAGYGAPQAAAAPAYGANAPYVSPNYAAHVPAQTQQALYGAQPVAAAQQAVAAAPTQLAAVAQPAQAAMQNTVAQAAAPVRSASAAAGAHVVTSGQTLSSLSRQYGVSRTELAAANGLDPNASVRIGQKLNIPGAATTAIAAATPKATQAAVAAVPAAKPLVAAATPAVTAAATQAVATASAEPKAQTIAAVKPAQSADDVRSDSGVQFRWPVRGRVISGFGPKPGGQQNEGINVSVPEGTSVKAAEDGVVAYAGSELKGYGNLVLIKHADGWVTAYAHNSTLDVKKGDTVKRGQVIAKAGQTGSVTSPQVHFEIRKGSQPVDPSQHLAGL